MKISHLLFREVREYGFFVFLWHVPGSERSVFKDPGG